MRIAEVEMISELGKEFSLSVESGRLVFAKLDRMREEGTIKEVTLETLSREIDRYRLAAAE
jgi:hypothetical protein